MVSKGLIKLINSLRYKKYREIHHYYIAEGEKLVHDLIKMNAPIKMIFSDKPIGQLNPSIEFFLCNSGELGKISTLKSSPGIIALVEFNDQEIAPHEITKSFSIALDGIQDPGNMGTIIRLANWFGIENIICSFDCADIYNPKVIQASMGAFLGVKISYTDLVRFINGLVKIPDFQIYGTFMKGESIYSEKFNQKGILVMGNEGNGISAEIEKLVSRRISIPLFHKSDKKTESLNVSVATGIIISEFARQNCSPIN